MDQIEILNWRKFNPRNDYKSIPWIRLETQIFSSESFVDFDPEELLFWIFLLTLAGRKNNPIINVNYKYFQRDSRISRKAIESAIRKLEEVQCVKISRSSDDRVTIVTGPDPFVSRSLRNVTNERNGTKRNETLRDETERNETDETISSADADSPVSTGSPPIPPLVDLWNSTVPEVLPKVRLPIRSPSRLKKIAARWKTRPPDEWKEIVGKIAESDFCRGKSSSAWIADFNWLLQLDVPDKILEGRYDNRRPIVSRISPASIRQEANAELMAKIEKGEIKI